MAQNITKSIVAGAWTQLTDANISAITFQIVSGSFVLVKATVGATAPTDNSGAILYNPRQGERNVALSDLFPGVAGANRVYAYSDTDAVVMVSHV